MNVILIPGLWLDASSWAPVTAALEAAGHRAHPVTPRGLEAQAGTEGSDVTPGDGDTPADEVTLADQAEAVTALVDSLEGPVVLVGHSGGGAVAHAVVDARPDRIARAIYVDSGPLGEGGVINEQLPVVEGRVPLPDWSAFDPEELRDLTEQLRAEFRARAIPVPRGVAAGPQHLHDERRYSVPVTILTCTMPAALLRDLMAQGHPMMRELARVEDVEIIELPTGHWPQFSRPAELAAAILGVVGATDS